MNIKRRIKYLLYPSLKQFAGILMFHRISKPDNKRLLCNEHLKFSPENLEVFIKSAQNSGFSFVSLDELCEIKRKNKKKYKVLAVTLDDGYRDNLTQGLPVFKKYNIPFCIFVSTAVPEKELLFWWYILEDILLKNTNIILSNGMVFKCSTKEEKENIFLTIRELILKIPQSELHTKLSGLFSNYITTDTIYKNELGLTWEDIAILHTEQLVTIGCHSHAHFSFNACSDADVISDIEYSLKLLNEKAKIKPEHFCFPFGDPASISSKHIEIVRSMKFKTASTTRPSFMSFGDDLLQLPRIYVNEQNKDDILKSAQYYIY